ncbi:hypothetical protein F4809DRAFT_665977 [Biscogniauxia mediterranea]|nr:hypothetical protein F4809DRAFT_665977 [Biscogniauxia mediterranea]
MRTQYNQEYHVRDLKARSVTLFPTRAQVAREIKGIALQKLALLSSPILLSSYYRDQDSFQDYYPDLDSDDVELEKDVKLELVISPKAWDHNNLKDQIDSQLQIRDVNRKNSELCIEDGRLRNIISNELEEACKNKVKMQKVKGKEKEKKLIRERLLAQEKNRIKKDKKAH